MGFLVENFQSDDLAPKTNEEIQYNNLEFIAICFRWRVSDIMKSDEGNVGKSTRRIDDDFNVNLISI